ncbi:MAG: hypothetical protein V8T87_01245 [Victivallales bacterium]
MKLRLLLLRLLPPPLRQSSWRRSLLPRFRLRQRLPLLRPPRQASAQTLKLTPKTPSTVAPVPPPEEEGGETKTIAPRKNLYRRPLRLLLPRRPLN